MKYINEPKFLCKWGRTGYESSLIYSLRTQEPLPHQLPDCLVFLGLEFRHAVWPKTLNRDLYWWSNHTSRSIYVRWTDAHPSYIFLRHSNSMWLHLKGQDIQSLRIEVVTARLKKAGEHHREKSQIEVQWSLAKATLEKLTNILSLSFE